MGHDDLNDAAGKMSGIMGPAAYGDGSSIVPKKRPLKKPKRAKRAKTPKKPKRAKRPKPTPTIKSKPEPKPKPAPKGRKTHSGSITQLGKGTRSQLEAIGYIDKPK